MIKRSFVFLLAVLACLSCTGCIEPVEKNENPGEPLAAQDSQMNIANPVKEMSREELLEQTGIELGAPDGASNMVYSMISLSEGSPIAQLRFELEGHELCLRAQKVAGENAFDISGMYYDWETTEHLFVSLNYAVVCLAGDVGYVKWIDAPNAIQYSLSMMEAADKDTLISLAEAVYEPLKD